MVLDAIVALGFVSFRHRLAGEDRAALAAVDDDEATAVAGLSDDEERFVRDVVADRLRETGSMIEIVERRFGPVPRQLLAPPTGPLRLLPTGRRQVHGPKDSSA